MSGAPMSGAPVQGRPEEAVKYSYDLVKKDWEMTRTRVVLDTRVAGSGGMRVVVRCDEVDNDGSLLPCLAKFFQSDISNITDQDYFNEAMAQCLCDEFAQNYNREGTPRKIAFLNCTVVRIGRQPIPLIFIMEPLLSGTFTKHSNNFGDVYESGAVGATAESFSHYTYDTSGQSMLVCDIQGVGDFFTDPQIHTEDGRGLGMGNMGLQGIEKWIASHRCNDICRMLKLKEFTPQQQQRPAHPRRAGQHQQRLNDLRQSLETSLRRNNLVQGEVQRNPYAAGPAPQRQVGAGAYNPPYVPPANPYVAPVAAAVQARTPQAMYVQPQHQHQPQARPYRGPQPVPKNAGASPPPPGHERGQPYVAPAQPLRGYAPRQPQRRDEPPPRRLDAITDHRPNAVTAEVAPIMAMTEEQQIEMAMRESLKTQEMEKNRW